jgi:hypothetical protein
MKQWTGTVVVSYTQKISVAAETQEKAEALMLDWFDPTYCLNTADGQVYDVVEIQAEVV